MEVLVGDRFFNPQTGMQFLVVSVSAHGSFVNWVCRLHDQEDWVVVMNPVRVTEIESALRKRDLIFDTYAGRLFYEKK